MKKLILTCSLLLAATGAHAQGTGSNPPVQAYTTLGPAGAGTYRESTQRAITAPPARRTRTPAPSARETRDTE